MADQASVSRGNGSQPPATPGGLVGNIAEFGNDMATLVELQGKLAVCDAKECVGRATTPLIALGAGAAVALGSLPIVLLGLADLIASAARVSPGAVRLVVGLVAMGTAAAVAYVSLRASLASFDSFRRSREELIRNVSWIRTVLVHSGRATTRPRV